MKKYRKIFLKFAIFCMGLVFIGVGAQTYAYTIDGYNVTTPRIGSITTGRIVKKSSKRGVHHNTFIGGGKRINTSIRNARYNTDITPQYQMGSGDRIYLSYNNGGDSYIGVTTTLGIASPLTTFVKLNVRGSWSADANR